MLIMYSLYPHYHFYIKLPSTLTHHVTKIFKFKVYLEMIKCFLGRTIKCKNTRLCIVVQFCIYELEYIFYRKCKDKIYRQAMFSVTLISLLRCKSGNAMAITGHLNHVLNIGQNLCQIIHIIIIKQNYNIGTLTILLNITIIFQLSYIHD